MDRTDRLLRKLFSKLTMEEIANAMDALGDEIEDRNYPPLLYYVPIENNVNLSSLITGLFWFDETKQGFDYWESIALRIEEEENANTRKH